MFGGGERCWIAVVSYSRLQALAPRKLSELGGSGREQRAEAVVCARPHPDGLWSLDYGDRVQHFLKFLLSSTLRQRGLNAQQQMPALILHDNGTGSKYCRQRKQRNMGTPPADVSGDQQSLSARRRLSRLSRAGHRRAQAGTGALHPFRTTITGYPNARPFSKEKQVRFRLPVEPRPVVTRYGEEWSLLHQTVHPYLMEWVRCLLLPWPT